MKITNQNSGHSFEANNNKSILDYALKNNFNYPHGCTNGFCGQCKALIIKGKIAYLDKRPKGLSKEDENDGYALLCQCYPKNDITLLVDELKPVVKTIKSNARVKALIRLNHNVVKIILTTDKKLNFLAGQYVDIKYSNLDYRSFSIANKPNSNNLEFHIRLIENGKFTNFVFNKLTIGDKVEVMGPKGNFYLRDNDNNILLIAGGTGFAPVKAIIEELIEQNDKRAVDFYWGVRDEKDLYSELPKTWQNLVNINYIPVLSNNNNWNGRSGFVHNAVLEDIKNFNNYNVYACGSPIMVEAVALNFTKFGMQKINFFNDSFDFNIKK